MDPRHCRASRHSRFSLLGMVCPFVESADTLNSKLKESRFTRFSKVSKCSIFSMIWKPSNFRRLSKFSLDSPIRNLQSIDSRSDRVSRFPTLSGVTNDFVLSVGSIHSRAARHCRLSLLGRLSAFCRFSSLSKFFTFYTLNQKILDLLDFLKFLCALHFL